MGGYKVEFTFDPFKEGGVQDIKDKLTAGEIREVNDTIKEFIRSQVIADMDKKVSSVDGTTFQRLSKKYKKLKQAAGKPGIPNLEFDGDLKNAIQVVHAGDGMLKIKVREGPQADKADGHCNHSGDSDLPPRRFIPAKKQSFREPINKKMASLIKGMVKG